MSEVSNLISKRLGEIASSCAGGTPSRAVPDFFLGGIPWVKSTEVNQSFVESTEEYISEAAVNSSSAKWVNSGSILVAMYGATAGEISELRIKATTNQAVLAINGLEVITNKYIYYYLINGREKLLYLAQGSGQPNLSKALVDDFIVKYPSLEKQQEITKILTTIDQLIDKTQSIINKQTVIKQGMMADLFTRGIDLSTGQLRPPVEQAPELYKETELGWMPREWGVNSIENILERIIDYRGKTPIKTESGIPLITAKNIRKGFVDPEPREYIAFDAYDRWMTRGIPCFGDVLFTTEAPLANVAQIKTGDKCAFAQRVIILRCNEKIDSDCFKYLLMSDSVQARIFSKGSGSTVEGIKQSQFRKILVSYPKDLNEQAKIKRNLENVEFRINSESGFLDKLSIIKRGLMQDLLTGKVTV